MSHIYDIYSYISYPQTDILYVQYILYSLSDTTYIYHIYNTGHMKKPVINCVYYVNHFKRN